MGIRNRRKSWRTLIALGAVALLLSSLAGVAVAEDGHPKTYISVAFVGNYDGQPSVTAGGWPIDLEVDLAVWDGTDIVFETSATMGPQLGGPALGSDAVFEMGDFWVERGQTITVTGSGITSSLFVSRIVIDEWDLEADVIRGSGSSGGMLMAGVFDTEEGCTVITSNPDGTWSVDVSACYDYELSRDSGFGCNDMGYDGGFTGIYAGGEEKGSMVVNFAPSWLRLWDGSFAADSPAEVLVYVGSNDTEPVWVSPVTTDSEGGVLLDPVGFELEPGMLVRIETDGEYWFEYMEVAVVDLEATDIDFDADTISGTAPGYDTVRVRPFDPDDNSNACDAEYPVVAGAWSVDYTAPGDCQGFDLQLGMEIRLVAFAGHAALRTVQPTLAVEAVSGPIDPVSVDTQVSATVTYSPGTSDTHMIVWDWGDGTGPDTTGSHVYDAPGVYTVGVTVTDDVGSDSGVFEYVVVYDPAAGFVTGGGWLDSPEGAYVADPTLSGKATFGFVARYKKGANVPTGNTQFQFHVADLDFHSTSYDWLVVAGDSTAKFKGVGTINGAGEYKFQIWALDDPDEFRIKIWAEDTAGIETVIYDNGAHQPLGGGSIVIHTK